MEENRNNDVVVFKSIERSLAPLFFIIVFLAVLLPLTSDGTIERIFHFCGAVWLSYIVFRLIKVRKSIFKINSDSLSICNKRKCETFFYSDIKSFNIEKSRLHGPYIGIEMHDGRVVKFIYYNFDIRKIHIEIKKQSKIVIKTSEKIVSDSEYRVDTYGLILNEKHKLSLKIFLSVGGGVLGAMFSVLMFHVLYMEYFSNTNYALKYFVEVWSTYTMLVTLFFLPVFFIYLHFYTKKIMQIRGELISNYPHMSFKEYKKKRMSRTMAMIFPVPYCVIMIGIHFTKFVYLTPVPNVQTEFVKQNVLERSWLDMRYICLECAYSILPGNVVYYYDGKIIKVGVASDEVAFAYNYQRKIASARDVELVVDSTLAKKKISTTSILGIARNKKGSIVVLLR